jgi:hypothetical protein
MLSCFRRFSSASSWNDTSLDLRILFNSRRVRVASRFKASSSEHMIFGWDGDSRFAGAAAQVFSGPPGASVLVDGEGEFDGFEDVGAAGGGDGDGVGAGGSAVGIGLGAGGAAAAAADGEC